MFEGWSHWTWVTVAWVELLVAYGGYLFYLRWRRQRLLRDERARRVLEREAGGNP